MKITPYISLARPDNWTKNLLLLVGAWAASMFCHCEIVSLHITTMLWMLASLCLASSANYVLNESIDAKSDAHHPIKKNRAAVKHPLNKKIIACEYVALVAAAIACSIAANVNLLPILVYIACAWVYNIPPVRLKNRAYADVLMESVNYPIRILLGWMCILPDASPPSSLLITSWGIGAFTMSLKRLAEYQMFDTPEQAVKYRPSYATYTLHSLILSGFVYAMFTILGITIILLKYKVEMIVLMPLIIAWMTWYFWMGLKHSICIIYPEKLLANRFFLLLLFTSMIATSVLLRAHFPWLQILNEPLIFNTNPL